MLIYIIILNANFCTKALDIWISYDRGNIKKSKHKKVDARIYLIFLIVTVYMSNESKIPF